MTDEFRLSQLCAGADEAACEELYRRYSPRLLSLCLRYCEDRESAEDTMHDAFVKILESMRKYKYKGEGSLYSWMARLTVNLCFDSLSKRRRLRRGFVDGYDASELPDESYENEQPEIAPEELKRMIDELPPMYSTVFKLYVIDELSHKEIGKLLGIKEKSSSSNLKRARMLLNKKIEQYCKE